MQKKVGLPSLFGKLLVIVIKSFFYIAFITNLTIDSMSKTSRCSSVVEHFLGKEEVVSSILINGSGLLLID